MDVFNFNKVIFLWYRHSGISYYKFNFIFNLGLNLNFILI